MNTISRYLLPVAGMAMLPATAHAHAMFGSAAPFWTGVLHVLVTPLALTSAVVFVLALAEAGERATLCALAAAAAAAFASAELTVPAREPSTISAVICVVAIAVATLLVRRPTVLVASALGIAAGIAAGHAVGADVPDWGGSLGVGIAVLVLTSWGAGGLGNLQAHFSEPVNHRERAWLARRIATGSIATGVLAMLAMNA